MPRSSKKTEKQRVEFHDTETLKAVIIDALQEIKGKDILEIRFDACSEQPLFDAFVLCSATSSIHAEALCENVQRRVHEKLHQEPSHFEGKDQAQWILMDYFDIVVHIFLEDRRRFYDIEGLWNDTTSILHDTANENK